MALPNAQNPTFTNLQMKAQQVTPAADSNAASKIRAGIKSVDVQAVTTNSNDWIVLPSLADVQVGHQIIIACNAGGNFELRTPAGSDEKINGSDADGTGEFTCSNAEIVTLVKISDTNGWNAQEIVR